MPFDEQYTCLPTHLFDHLLARSFISIFKFQLFYLYEFVVSELNRVKEEDMNPKCSYLLQRKWMEIQIESTHKNVPIIYVNLFLGTKLVEIL